MIDNIKKSFQSSTAKRLLSNFFSLSSIQIASYILPLITIPYLVRVLGVEKFGLIAFSQVLIQYFVIFTDYGFSLSATKEIAENNENKEKVDIIFSSVIVIKIIFLCLSFIILNILVFSFEKFQDEWELYYLTFGIAIGQAMFPVWYFQGIEKMHITALINILPKIVFTIFIFIFIQTSDDYLYVALINSLGFLLAGVFSLWIAIKQFKVVLYKPNIKEIKHQLVEGWHIFLGGISSNFSSLNITFFLGILTTPTIVGYYASIEKIIRPLASLNRLVINTIFPYLAKTKKTSALKAYNFSKKISFIVGSVMFSIGLGLFIFSKEIIIFIFGKEFLISAIVLKIMAFIPMIHTFLHIYAIPNMIIFDFKKVYSKIVFSGFIISILSSFLFIKFYDISGAAYSSLVTELFLLVLFSRYLQKNLKIKVTKI